MEPINNNHIAKLFSIPSNINNNNNHKYELTREAQTRCVHHLFQSTKLEKLLLAEQIDHQSRIMFPITFFMLASLYWFYYCYY